MNHPAMFFGAAALLAAMLLSVDVPASSPGEDPPLRRDRVPRPVELRDDALVISDRFALSFQRTLRIPDDGRRYPLPPGLGRFPLYRVRDFADRVPEGWDREHGYFIPMYQREAMWIDFDGAHWKPNAVKVGVGLVNAVSGTPWDLRLHADPQDYLVVPEQPWLDGIKAGEGMIRQFIAVPLGTGQTVEAQVRGEESDGALRIAVFEPKPGRFPDDPPPDMNYYSKESVPALSMQIDSRAMGLGAGGRMKQKVYPDSHGIDTWSGETPREAVIYIINSEQFEAITGRRPPESPVDAATYTSYGFPWFDLYDERKPDLPASDALRGVKSPGELQGTVDSSVAVPDSSVIKLK